MAAPSALALVCETCGEVPHRVLSGRVTGKDEFIFQGTVKCSECGRIRSVTVREEKPIAIPVVVSAGGRSERMAMEFGPDEMLRVGERLDQEGHRVEVTAIEAGARRVPASKARNVTTLWAKRMDRVCVKVSLAKRNRTVAHELDAAPDEEFEVGDLVDLGKERALIYAIRVGDATRRQGSARAEDIVCIYGKVVRERTSY